MNGKGLFQLLRVFLDQALTGMDSHLDFLCTEGMGFF